jgi:hypothetical protein
MAYLMLFATFEEADELLFGWTDPPRPPDTVHLNASSGVK